MLIKRIFRISVQGLIKFRHYYLYWDLVATEVLNDDKLECNNSDYTAGVLLAKDSKINIYILDSYEFQLESRNLINEIINNVARNKVDMQYSNVDESIGKNFEFLIIGELTRI